MHKNMGTKDLSVDGRIITRFSEIQARTRGCELDSPATGYGPMTDSCEHRNEPSGSIKGGGRVF
jgi:hypothetical protein